MVDALDSLASPLREFVDPDLLDLADRVLGPGAERAETSGAGQELAAWAALRPLGLDSITTPEAAGGGGGRWRDAAAVLVAGARHGVSTPLVEHDILAGWVLDQAGVRSEATLRTVAVVDEAGMCANVGWARFAQSVVVLSWSGARLRLDEVPIDEVEVVPGSNLAGEPRDGIRVDVRVLGAHELDPGLAAKLQLRGALARSVQIAAALRAACQLTVDHLSLRHQFGRPLSRFQALQHALADAYCEVVLVEAAVSAACQLMDSDDVSAGRGLATRVAVARSCASHGVGTVVRTAHQLHGAIGTTDEHPLHRVTLPALAWRSEFGTPRHWDDTVAAVLAGASPDQVWSALLAE